MDDDNTEIHTPRSQQLKGWMMITDSYITISTGEIMDDGLDSYITISTGKMMDDDNIDIHTSRSQQVKLWMVVTDSYIPISTGKIMDGGNRFIHPDLNS